MLSWGRRSWTGPQHSMIMAATASAEWNPNARQVIARTRRLSPSVRPLLMPNFKGGQDAVAMSAYGAAEFDEGGQATALRPGQEAVQQVGGLAGSEVVVEHGPQALFALVGAPHRAAGAFDRGQLVRLGVVEVPGAFECRWRWRAA